MEQDYKYLGWKNFSVEYLENNCDKVRKLACEKALHYSIKSSSILQDAYEEFSKIPDNKQRTQYLSMVEAMESMIDINYYNLILEKLITDANTFYMFQVSLKFNDPLSFGCIVDRNLDIIFRKLSEERKKNLREIINLAYDQYETSHAISELIKILLEKLKSLNKREMIVSLPPISADFQGNNKEFEDICVMHRIIDSMTKEVSETSQHWMDDSGEIRIGHKSNFHVKSLLIAGEVKIGLMEASRILPTDKKIHDDWDKLIKLMKDAHVRLLRKLTRGRVGDVKEIEEDLNKVPVFGIQVAETMACWVMTMPFGAFYFIQHLGSVQISMNRGQSSLAGFMNELWKLRASLRNHIRILNKIVEKVDVSLYNIAFCSPQAREDVPLYDGEQCSSTIKFPPNNRQSLRTSLTIAIAKSAKRNRRKKLTRYAYKVLANQGKEATIIPSNDKDIQNNEAPTVNPNIHDNTDNQKKHEKAEIFYNPEKPSTVVSPKSTFIEKFLEKRRERRIANQIPIDDISSIPEKYMKLLEVEIFREPNVLESIPQDLWNEFGQWAYMRTINIRRIRSS
ncbi:13138_t:CDS:10 [Ambispora leptoticha]|uniref:13138_t:CDS:1 n=1 Tax=Ambispora leptoticha TaxID=144679 RepID=A0A9N8WH12_9GLOM|nr:13138_t:CDS:10 [Ambispora leptoticha]